MPSDLFDQLAASKVPPPPAQFERGVHDRLNRALLVGQLLDLVCGAFPAVVFHFARAACAALCFTLTGRYPKGGGGNQP